MRPTISQRAILGTALLGLIFAAATAGAWDDWGGDRGGWGGSYDGSFGGGSDVRYAVSYINPDIGAATANPNIDPASSCETPDRYDEDQPVSPAGTTRNNVHNDSCLLDRDFRRVDGGATYESYGVGYISACPDPDNAGPKTARLSAGPTGTPATRCTQSGYQEKNIAGDEEFHARMNSFVPGQQTVVWCYDESLNGCFDDFIQDVIVIKWR